MRKPRPVLCPKCRHRTLYYRVEMKFTHKVLIFTCYNEKCGHQFTRKVRRWS